MNADSTFTIGTTHTVCQDYALSHSSVEGSFVIVSDGCSTSRDSDFGARLLARAAAKIISGSPEVDHRSVHEAASLVALQWAQGIQLPKETADATLLTAYADADNLLIGATGDGVVILESTSEETDVYSISFPAGFPLYPTYLHQADRLKAWQVASGAIKEVKRFHAASICEPLQLVETWITSEATEVFRLSAANYRHVVLISDGIHSFYRAQETITSRSLKSIPMEQQLPVLVSFKGTHGAFVARRVKRFMKEGISNGLAHADDLAIAAIYLGD